MGFQDLKSRTIQRLDYGNKSDTSFNKDKSFKEKSAGGKKKKIVVQDSNVDELPF